MRGVKRYIFSSLGVLFLFALSLVLFRSSGTPVTDALFFTGAISASLGILAVLSARGEFSSLGYILSRAVGMLVPGTEYKHETLYDYKKRKSEERGAPPYPLVLIGVILIVCSLMMLVS